jgi:hypothetical protein
MRTASRVWTDCWARELGVFGRQHASRIGFSVADDIKSNVVVSYLRERDRWGDPGVDGRITLGWIFKKWDVGVRTGLGWLRIVICGGRL